MAFLWLTHGGDPNHLVSGVILQVYQAMDNWADPYKVGPLPVINGVITPISRDITLVTHL